MGTAERRHLGTSFWVAVVIALIIANAPSKTAMAADKRPNQHYHTANYYDDALEAQNGQNGFEANDQAMVIRRWFRCEANKNMFWCPN